MRSHVAGLIERRAEQEGRTLPMAAEHLARALFALSNGIALEKLGDPAGVPDELFGDILGLLLQDLAGPGRPAVADPGRPAAAAPPAL